MEQDAKDKWLRRAEVIDSLRLFPRLIVGASFVYTSWLVGQMLFWYFNQPAWARGAEESTMIGATCTTLTGLFYKLWQDYSSKGRDWNNAPPPAAPGKVVE